MRLGGGGFIFASVADFISEGRPLPRTTPQVETDEKKRKAPDEKSELCGFLKSKFAKGRIHAIEVVEGASSGCKDFKSHQGATVPSELDDWGQIPAGKNSHKALMRRLD
eukprot:7565346-Pyramimonas_sp.AAC.1